MPSINLSRLICKYECDTSYALLKKMFGLVFLFFWLGMNARQVFNFIIWTSFLLSGWSCPKKLFWKCACIQEDKGPESGRESEE